MIANKDLKLDNIVIVYRLWKTMPYGCPDQMMKEWKGKLATINSMTLVNESNPRYGKWKYHIKLKPYGWEPTSYTWNFSERNLRFATEDEIRMALI